MSATLYRVTWVLPRLNSDQACRVCTLPICLLYAVVRCRLSADSSEVRVAANVPNHQATNAERYVSFDYILCLMTTEYGRWSTSARED
ncbi:hypothetical protein BDW71DRAFT_179490 [Aspergillus fruticulosus]